VPVATDTPVPTVTNTPPPTVTLEPTITPDAAATQKVEDYQAMLAKLNEKGFIGTSEGQSIPMKDFKGEYALMHDYYKWWSPAEVKGEIDNFVFSAHFKWGSYSSTPEISGCGIGFGIKENGDHYALFLDRYHLYLYRQTGVHTYQMGSASRETFPAIDLPTKADIVIAVWDKNVTVSVNGFLVFFILSADQDAQGKFAYSLLSGTNSGYGTRCEMSNIALWTPK
jgi:hypothetical protein